MLVLHEKNTHLARNCLDPGKMALAKQLSKNIRSMYQTKTQVELDFFQSLRFSIFFMFVSFLNILFV